MATIIQINRVNTNRSGAADDVYGRLQSRSTGANLTIDARHLSLGTGLTVSATGALDASPQSLNLSDVETFATITARNAHDTTVWHEGDVAIITEETMVPGGTALDDTGFIVTGFVGSSIRLFNAWDTTNDVPVNGLGFANGDTIRFVNTSGDTVGTTTPGNNGDFVVSNLRQQTTGSTNALFDITPPLAAFNPALDVGSRIFALVAQPATTVPIGTYVYVGADQTSAAATTNDDWELLRTPTSTNLDASAIASGTFDEARIPTTIARTNQLRTLTFTQSGNLVSGNSNLTENASNQVTAIAIAAFTGLTTFPEEVGVFVNGLKVADNEVTFNVGRTTATFSTPIEFPTTGNLSLTFELMYLV